MPFLALVAGIIIAAAAIEGTQGQLATALETDLPPYFKWAAAFLGVGALGYVPGLQSLSRWLMALVVTVLVVQNYNNIFSSFANLAKQPAQPVQAPTDPTQQFQQATQQISGLPTATQGIAGTSGTTGAGGSFMPNAGFGTGAIGGVMT